MGTEKPLSASAPPLAVLGRGTDRILPAGPSYTLGRDPGSNIVIPRSRCRGSMRFSSSTRDSWVLEDIGSTNGTFLGAQKVQRITLGGEITVRLGASGRRTRADLLHRGAARGSAPSSRPGPRRGPGG